MASENAIAAVSQSLVWLLAQGCPRRAFGLADADFVLVQASEIERKRPTRGISVLLYRVTVNVSMRDQAPRRRVLNTGPRSLPLELHYLITPWADSAESQQKLLGWVIRFLERCPAINDDVLNQTIPGAFSPGESVQLVADSLEYAGSTLNGLGPTLPPSAAYAARLLMS